MSVAFGIGVFVCWFVLKLGGKVALCKASLTLYVGAATLKIRGRLYQRRLA